ncbi:MAG: DUF5050 domain-containing protein [Christensenellaceae bacterium]|jgi:hypothetical protein|nr:DUF5050 domain-containing protein [Christensenellaceae bacterium]
MKKKLVFLAAMCLTVVMAFAGCGIALSGGPGANDPIYGNGSLAVRKGEWLYFVNAFKSYETVNVNGNKFGDEKLSGIYRTKLNANGLVETDDDGMPVGAELVVPQIAGYENGGIYIFGDYIYYSTPKTLNDKTGVAQRGLYSFERVKLDGTEHKTLYFADNVSSNFQVVYQQVGEFVYIIIRNGTEVRSVEVGLKNDKVYNRILAQDVVSVAFSQSDKNTSSFEQYVYYTKTATIADNGFDGYQIMRSKFDGSVKDDVIRSVTDNLTLNNVKNSRIYYEFGSKLYSTTNFVTSHQYASSGTDKITPYFVLGDQNGVNRGIVTNYESKLVRFVSTSQYYIIENSVSEILTVVGEFVYFKQSGSEQVFRIRFDGSGAKEVVINSISLQINSKNYFDCDGEYIFYFNTVENSNQLFSYLHMIKIGAQNEESELFSKFIGVLDETDVKVEE